MDHGQGLALPRAERGRRLMKAERWQRVTDLFHSADERAPEERAAFLEEACDGDEDLCREVKSLLTSHERTENFIESPAFEVAPELLTGRPGRRIGWRIDWSLPDRVAHRHRRNGRGLSCAGRATRAQSRAQASPRALDGGRDATEPVQNRGAQCLGLKSSEHSDGLRDRRGGKPAIHRDGVHRRHDAARVARVREDESARRAGNCRASGLGAGCRARSRRRAPRHQTGEHHAATGRIREGARLRDCQTDRAKAGIGRS